MTDASATTRVLFVAGRPDRWRAARSALEATDGMVVTTATALPDGPDLDPGVDCVVATHDEATDGVAILEAARASRPAVPVVLLAGSEADLAASRALAAGVSGVGPTAAASGDASLVDRVEATAARRAARDGGTVPMPIDEVGVHEELRLKQRAIDEAPVGITISDPDRPDNPLIYVNDAFAELTGYDKREVVGRNCRLLQGEDSDPEAVAAMRTAINAGEPVSVELLNYTADGEPFWNRVHIAPVHDAEGEVTNFVGFQTDISERKRAEMAARRRREELEHVLVRINGLLGDVTREVVRAGSRREVESAVCERVVAADTYAFGWVGVPDHARGTLVASTTAGEQATSGAAPSVDRSAEAADPTTTAFETGDVQAVRDPSSLDGSAGVAPWLDDDAVGGIAAVPLSYDETTYGVLTLYATDGAALNDNELVVLEALGRTAGTAINALERGRMLASDAVTELVLETTDSDLFFVALSAETGCSLEYRGAVQRDDGSVLTFFVTDAGADAVRAVAADSPRIEAADPIHEYDQVTLWEFALGEGSVAAALAERGATLRSIEVADGAAEVTVELPTQGEARAVVEALSERYPETTVVAHRARDRPPQSRRGFVADLEERLTERQLTALRKAHVSGYYERDRSVTGEDLAVSMGIDRSTYHQHLRAAERKLMAAFFERRGPGN